MTGEDPAVRSEERASELGLSVTSARRRWVHYECLNCGTRVWRARLGPVLESVKEDEEILPDCEQESIRLIMVS